ncbi:MAG: glycogen/starch/alpha-glucan phosphorylase, partial [Chromatiaceae bacterium]
MLLPEALEQWPVTLFERLLPRYLEIIHPRKSCSPRSARRNTKKNRVVEMSLADLCRTRRVKPQVSTYHSNPSCSSCASWFNCRVEVHEINARFLDQVRLQALSETERVTRLSLINEADERHVRMAHLACVGGVFSGGDGELFRPLVETLLHRDPYLVLADFESYVNTQMRVDK